VIRHNNSFKNNLSNYLVPFTIGSIALVVAIIGAFLTGEDDVTKGVNGFVENLSSQSSSVLGDLGFFIPLGFAFGAGMVSTVNPCGFAMLPAYLGFYMNSATNEPTEIHLASKLRKALLVGTIVTLSFVFLFGVFGIIIVAGVRTAITLIPWLGLATGTVLILSGSWLWKGNSFYTRFPSSIAGQIGNPNVSNVRGYFLFGFSYGIASLSCTLPIFLSVIGLTFTETEFLPMLYRFFMYSMGMGTVIILITVGIATFQETSLRLFRKSLPIIQPISSVLMILAGAYIIFYWLTLGRYLL
jgi:cytochrome c-type biogenesis protein